MSTPLTKTDWPISASLVIDALGPDLRAALSVARDAGFAGIAVANGHPELASLDFGSTARRHLRHLLQRQHLRVACIRAVSTRGGLFDAKTLDRVMASAVGAIRLAHDLGAFAVSLYAGSPESSPGSAMTLSEPVVAAVQALAGEADQAGLKLCLSSSSVDFLLALLGRLGAGHLRANLDTARLPLDGPALLQAADRLGQWVGMWTLADSLQTGTSFRPTELGQGYLPVAEILARTEGRNWGGALLVDVRDLPDPQQGARTAAQVLRSAWLR
jgi:sugar phosphate isomerase/epimerase